MITHIMNFSTLYLPGTIKDIRLYFRATTSSNSYLDMNYKKKIVVKQSYILLVWMNYLVNSFKDSQNKSTTGESITLDNSKENSKIPAFFIYPRCNYKTTIQKAPMAHKTFSQEQYMIRFYKLSITFNVDLSLFLEKNKLNTKNILVDKHYPLENINNSIYYSLFLFKSIPVFSTNMFWLNYYSVVFCSTDTNYFSFFHFIAKG